MKSSALFHKMTTVQKAASVLCILLLPIFFNGCRGCMEKGEEQEITITLQTEKPTETTVAPTEVKPQPRVKKEVPQRASKATESAPMTIAPQPTKGSDLELIQSVLDRQKKAFEAKDLDLYLSDLATVTDKETSGFRDSFKKYDEIMVEFTIESLDLKGEMAHVTMLQKTRLRLKGSNRIQEGLMRVLWGFIKKEGNWKIAEFKKIESIR